MIGLMFLTAGGSVCPVSPPLESLNLYLTVSAYPRKRA